MNSVHPDCQLSYYHYQLFFFFFSLSPDNNSRQQESEWKEKAKVELEEWHARQNEQLEKTKVNNRYRVQSQVDAGRNETREN